MYAINRNKLSSKTVHVLKSITKDTSKPFVIPSIVDRMAAMLNYVLKQLVGKESKNLKVQLQYNCVQVVGFYCLYIMYIYVCVHG